MGCKTGLGMLLLASLAAAQIDTIGVSDYTVIHPECTLFGPKYDQFVAKAVTGSGVSPHQAELSALTSAVASVLPFFPREAALTHIKNRTRPAPSITTSSA